VCSDISERREILVVDNDEAVTRALSLRLNNDGYICHAAQTGMQAVSLFDRYPIDAIVTDLNMPCGSGTDLIKTIRRTSDVPIIVVTGFSNELGKDVKGLNVTVLRKPFETRAVIDLIELGIATTKLKAA
jgi:DNA-binding response OmpR family regulator